MKGAGYTLTGLRWLPKSGLRRFVAMPLLINVVLLGAGICWWTGSGGTASIKSCKTGCPPGWIGCIG